MIIRICVCSLLPILYKTKQLFGDSDVIVDMYDDLCKDTSPMVRKAAISIIPEFIKVMDVLFSLYKIIDRKKVVKLIFLVISIYLYVMIKIQFVFVVIQVVLL